MDNKKISVVVPVYNVELYLEKCVNSIINQKYRNLEIILVDDGSPDNSGKICDSFLEKDNRIKVIHKSNGGLSDARNAGIDIATGDFITFVDSDDWIEQDIYYNAMKKNKKNDSDIIVFGIQRDYDDGKKVISKLEKEEILTNVEGLIYLNSFKNIDLSSCNKIYKKELFDNIRFPINKKCEDYYIMFKLFDISQKILLISDVGYHYFQRTGSIANNAVVNLDYIYASEKQLKYFEKKYPELLYIAETDYAFANMALFNFSISNNLKNKEQRKLFKINSKKYKKSLIKNQYIKKSKKIRYILFICLPFLYATLIKIKKIVGD